MKLGLGWHLVAAGDRIRCPNCGRAHDEVGFGTIVAVRVRNGEPTPAPSLDRQCRGCRMNGMPTPLELHFMKAAHA